MRYKNFSTAIYTAFITMIFACSNVIAYDDQETHKLITKSALENSRLNDYLRSQLGFSNGIDTKVPVDAGMAIRLWLEEGSKLEDSPQCRASNHFHDPTKLWTSSAMTDEPLWLDIVCAGWKPWYSNITWATGYQEYNGPIINRANQEMGWDNARTYFYSALTATTRTDRETNFGKTFQSVGQVMHLLQDMAVPAHVRNDFKSHLAFGFKPWYIPYNPFEFYVKEKPGMISSLTSTIISENRPTFPQLTDFWDTTQYRLNCDPNAVITGAGLAEYTNANFFSDSTIPNNNPTTAHIFQSPRIRVDSLHQHLCLDHVPGKAELVKYVSRKPCLVGRMSVDHFAALSLINSEEETSFTNPHIKEVWLDDNVHNTYAQDLLPRAIGYSAGLLNYFFRGELGAELVTRTVTTGEVSSGIKIKNQSTETMASPTDSATGNSIGNIEIYYDAITDTTTIPPTTERRLLKTCPLSTTDCWQTPPNQLLPEQETDPIFFLPPTDNANPNQYTVVFRGKLGNEEGTVMAGRVNAWKEEWNGELKSNHAWLTTDELYQYYDPVPGNRTQEVASGKLTLENTYGGYSHNEVWAREAYSVTPPLGDQDVYSFIRYCQQKTWPGTPLIGCFPYDFGLDFPIRVTPNTMIRLKVDEASIEPFMDSHPAACDTPLFGRYHYQGINLKFDNGENLFLTVPGQEGLGNITYFTVGREYAVNLMDLFRTNGIAFSEPLHLLAISIEQVLSSQCDREHTQRLAVDYIRIEER